MSCGSGPTADTPAPAPVPRRERPVAKSFRKTRFRRIADAVMTALVRRGIGPPPIHVLTTRGRTTGRPHSTPVSLVIEDGRRWLVAPYGEVGWVRNLRANGEATLQRGRRVERLAVEDLDPEPAAPVLQRYVRQEGSVRSYFDADADADLAAFVAEASRHPVFAITPMIPGT